MNFREYINLLENEKESTNYIELDKEKELHYLRDARFRFEEINNSIPHSTDVLKILDIGTTPFTLFIKASNPHYEVSSMDRTDLLENRCKAIGIEFKTCDLDEQSIPFNDDYFDIIIFTEVLEHIFSPPTRILKEIKRVLNIRGKLIISVPNIATLLNRIRFLFGKTPLMPADAQFKKDWVHGHGHIHEYVMDEIVSLLKDCGFEISKKKYLQHSIADTIQNINKSNYPLIFRLVYRVIGILFPSLGGKIIFIECKKQKKYNFG